MRFPCLSLLLFIFCAPLFAQEEEEKISPPRDWKATTGQTLKAVALAYDGTEVTLRDARRRELKLPANKLIAEDMRFTVAGCSSVISASCYSCRRCAGSV